MHDVCAAIHPLALASPFMRTVPLVDLGVEFVTPSAELAHPLDGGRAVLLERSLDATAAGLGRDERAYKRLLGPHVRHSDELAGDLLAPLQLPRHPLSFALFGAQALLPARGLAQFTFRNEEARALMAGVAAHWPRPLEHAATAGAGLMLSMLGHSVGWPAIKGGSQKLVDALAAHVTSLGGRIVTDTAVASIDELPRAGAYLFDVTPRQLVTIAGHRFHDRYRKQLEAFRYGPGVFKVDFATSEPVPWAADACKRAATVHIGGTIDEISAAERAAFENKLPERPFVIAAQPSLFDETRAPKDHHTFWAYCHVPHGSRVDMTERIEAQIERFAPGFRDTILARSAMDPSAMETHNPNNVGGDVNGGLQDLRQLFTRPTPRLNPYTTPAPNIFICSSSTPPGGGVHGMCGHFAARAALKKL